MQRPIPLVVFTDLDGTLLDHETYSRSAAVPALGRLELLGCPVILASSKTAAEIAHLQNDMGLSANPAIVENGAGLIWPNETSTADQTTYERLRTVLAALPDHLRAPFTGFGDMTSDEVSNVTGLSRQEAHLARTRSYSEPGLWHGSEEGQKAFVDALTDHGVSARMGGRFLTLSFGQTKQDRMADVVAHYAPLRTLALGDAPNDAEMLEAADHGIIVRNPHHAELPVLNGEKRGHITRTDLSGPEGWNASVNAFLDHYQLEHKGLKLG